MGHARAVPLLSLLLSATYSWRLAAQCPDGSPAPCSRVVSHAPARNSVAVLYLDNLSRDTADAYLADGLTEEIIIRLGQIHRIEVKSRFEVQRFRGRSALDPQVLGRSLNAAYLMTGSVQRAGARVRLRVALVRASTRAQVWGDVIDHASSDLLTMESDIARQVATSITGTLLPEERTRLARTVTADPDAYEEYLRGIALVDSTFEERPLPGSAHPFRSSDCARFGVRSGLRWHGFRLGVPGRCLRSATRRISPGAGRCEPGHRT